MIRIRGLLTCLAIVGNLLLFGCSSRDRAETHVSSTASIDSTRSEQHDSSAPSVDSAASYQYADSAGFFNPDGYYSPVEAVRFGTLEITWIGMNTAEYYYDGAAHYDRPRLVLPPRITLWLTEGIDHRSTYTCVQTLVSPDSVSARCLNSPIGDVSIDGHLLDKSGEYFNKSEYDDYNTVLLIARLVITKDGVTLHDRMHRFKWWNGD